MARLLAETIARMNPASNPYANDARLQFVRSVPAPEDNPKDLARYLFILGQESVLAGESEQAVAALERLRKMVKDGEAKLDPSSARTVTELTALAYLRLGEQENCIEDHNIDRCLLPIRGSGVHSKPRGSRGAIRIYQELLAEDPGNLDYRWLLNLAYMTLGEHPEKVPPRFLIPAAAFEAERPMPRFRDVAPALGLDVFGLAGGSIVDDFDGDGLLDVVASSSGRTHQLRFFRNLGDGTFRDGTEEAGIIGMIGGLNIAHADYDNDGRLDILVLRGGWWGDAGRHPNSLLRNDGVGEDGHLHFTESAEQSRTLRLRPTQVGVWADYDNDGWLDLFVGNETTGRSSRHPAELFRNDGRGPDGQTTFTEVAAAVGIDVAVPIKGAAWGDIDNDGLMDLFISNNHGDNLLFHNRGPTAAGGWSFVEIGGPAGVREPKISFPTWFWDFDNDGDEDIFVSGYAGTLGDLASEYLGQPVDPTRYPKLYRNNGNLTFTDVAPKIGLDRVLVTMGANFGDIDNDGWLDFYASTGNTQMQTLMPNRLLRNDAGRRFEDVTASGGFGHLQKGHGIAFGDLDHDGDQDIYAVMGGSHSGDGFYNALFVNPGNGNHWLSLELQGVRSNRSAIGARLKLTVATAAGDRVLYRTVSSGGSFGSNTLRQEIGLGKATAIRSLEIRWPGSKEPQTVRGLRPDGFYRIRQGSEPEKLERPAFALGGGATATPRHHGG
ncbi:MAG: CRTAC1 family protein [bacterium]|nr:CRTAC1 family protein [bacterium]